MPCNICKWLTTAKFVLISLPNQTTLMDRYDCTNGQIQTITCI